MYGLLGSRIALAIGKSSDMEVSTGIVKSDPTLRSALSAFKQLPEGIRKRIVPERMYLDDKHATVRELNASQDVVRFEPADQLNVAKECDALIDAASPGSSQKWMERYTTSNRTVILQSGEYPHGSLIVAPVVKDRNAKIHRQGDCVLSGIVPVLASLAPLAARITMHILTQYTEKLNDYTTDQRLGTVYLREEIKEQLETELVPMFPETNLTLLGVTQASGLSFYTATLLVETREALSGQQLKELLSGKPRIRVVPDIRSTFEIAHYKEIVEAFDGKVQPITVFGSGLNSNEKTTMHRIMIAIDYRYIAVLPNIDAVRMLASGMDGEQAMKVTDRDMNFA